MLKPVKPMLAVLAPHPFDSPDYYFEFKLDGVRALAYVEENLTRLQGRNLSDLSAQFPELLNLHHKVNSKPVVLDGEIVCLDDRGYPSFESIQNRIHKAFSLDIKFWAQKLPATYLVFDVLYIGDEWVMNKPLVERKSLLNTLLQPNAPAQVIKFVNGEGVALFKLAQEHELEGVIAKLKSSPYLPGKRSAYWQKFKTKKEGIFVIGGLTIGEGKRQQTFGSAILGLWDKEGKLRHVGNVGTGFSDHHLEEILRLCHKLRVEKSPFYSLDLAERVLLWCQPVISCEVRYLDITQEGKLRSPSFRRFILPKGLSSPKASLQLG